MQESEKPTQSEAASVPKFSDWDIVIHSTGMQKGCLIAWTSMCYAGTEETKQSPVTYYIWDWLAQLL